MECNGLCERDANINLAVQLEKDLRLPSNTIWNKEGA